MLEQARLISFCDSGSVINLAWTRITRREARHEVGMRRTREETRWVLKCGVYVAEQNQETEQQLGLNNKGEWGADLGCPNLSTMHARGLLSRTRIPQESGTRNIPDSNTRTIPTNRHSRPFTNTVLRYFILQYLGILHNGWASHNKYHDTPECTHCLLQHFLPCEALQFLCNFQHMVRRRHNDCGG